MGLIEYLSRRKEERGKRKEIKSMIAEIARHDETEWKELEGQIGSIYFWQHRGSRGWQIPESPTRETLRNYLETCSHKTQRKYSHYMKT